MTHSMVGRTARLRTCRGTADLATDPSAERSVADALRAAGEAVEVHDDHYDADAADQPWLAEVGGKAWVVLSKDDRIPRNPVEREALS
jgi:hypothetical protein